MRPPPFLMSAAVFCCAVFVLPACGSKEDAAGSGKGGGKGGGKGDSKVPVLVAEVVRKPMPLILSAIGNALPQTTVVLKPQVTGQISEVHFQEGQDVKSGDLLFTIDPRPATVALAKSDADLEKARAVAADAESRAKNYSTLERAGISKDELNRIQTDAASARASVLASEAAQKSAQLNLEYCSIKAPQDGRTGAILVHPGNVVQANTTDLVVINQVAPIQASFALAEQFLGSVTEYMKQGKLKVMATPEGKDAKKAEGEVVFLSNQVNRAAGTIELKALFPNTERALWPGQFVTVDVVLTTESDRVVAPVRAVQTGQKGQFVFVVKEDNTAGIVPVKMARSVGEEAVIEEGLKGGERVVVDGQGQLAEGSKVDIKTAVDAVVKPEGENQRDKKDAEKNGEKDKKEGGQPPPASGQPAPAVSTEQPRPTPAAS